MKRPSLSLIVVLSLLGATVAATAAPAAAVATGVVINEVDADQVSTDSAEFVELYDGGAGSTDLSGLSIVLFNGSDDASYLAFDLDGQSTDGDGYFVLCGNAANVANCDLDVSPDTNLIQNGADAVALISGDASNFPNDTPIPTTGIIDAIVYDTSDSDDTGLLVLLNAGQPQIDERGGGDSTAHSNQRCANGSGGARNTDTYTQATPTPGATNNCPAPPAPSVLINEVDADQVSTDSAEFVELYDGGAGNTDLTGLSIVLFNGSDDASYLAFDLDGLSTNGDGYFVLCGNAANVANCDLDVSPDTNLIQNGADAVALISGDASNFPNDTPIPTTGIIDAIVYDTNDSDDTGLLVLLNAGQPQINEGGAGNNTGHSNQRCANGSGGARNTDTYTQATPTPGATNNCPAPPAPSVLINEVDADQVSTDSAEFVELYDGGAGNTDLSGLSIVLFNGSDDASYLAFDLDGQSTDGDGYFVLCGNAANVANCDLDVSPDTNLIQNGADAVALISGDASNFPNDTPIPTTGVIDAIVYDTNDSDDPGLLVLLNAGQPQINEGGAGNNTGHSNQRCANGSGGARNTDTYTQATPTPGATNNCSGPALPVAMFIHDVQGSTGTSPVNGQAVIIEGVVVGDFQDTDINGFFLQEEDADADADTATSEGIYVYEGGSAVEVKMGDTVRVTGTAVEFSRVTEINNVTLVEVTGSGATASPVILSFPVASANFENIEGMGVTIPQSMTITEYFNFDRFGEISIGTGRLQQPTATFEPGSPESAALADLNSRSRITLDDGWTGQNVDPARHPNGAVFDLTNRFRGGDLLANVTGVMHDSFGYRIHPTAGADYTAASPRTASPDDVGGDVTVASFNVLNYFTTLDDGSGSICGPASNQGCRGADNAGELTRQRAKIVSAISQIDADVVGLIEIENHVADAALIDLVSGLNDAMGAGTYDYVPAGATGDDVIKVAFIYKPATVSLNEAHAVLDTPDFIDPNGSGRDRNRAALAQTFTENATGESFTAVVNHLKSKGSSCGAGDDDPEAASCNLTRTLAAKVLADWLAADPTGSGDPDVLIIGDLNSYDKEDPIDALKAGSDDTAGTADDYRDLVFEFIGEDAYSFVFSAQWAYLDYAMANESLRGSVTGTTIWHINSDEPDILDYDTSFKRDAQDALYEPNAFRSSDHDPVIVGLNLANPMGDVADAASDLAALLPTGNANSDRRLASAVAALEMSLDGAWWTSDQTIVTKSVFDMNRHAVAMLTLVAATGGPEADAAQSAIDAVLNADRQLAQVALIAAIAGGGRASNITRSQSAMEAATSFVAAGGYVAAVNAYKAAWDAATKS